MYNSYFGFREKPFKLVPDPAYLFLSRSHEEAFAHLRYAVSQGDGFVLITGEVGTGKTTLCRTFLDSLDDNTEAAFIFNPKLDPIQLLKAINDEFEISSDADNTKDLIDALNTFLMAKRAQGKHVILLIDEAQNLTGDVLEQLRLLSNLETSVSKLLQIVLVGQPELGDLLDSFELRQLGQRITLSCHLVPLSGQETREYIRFRLSVAAQRRGVQFTSGAFRRIHRYSKGFPRLINIACDRALLTAFGLNRQKITGSIATMAVRELRSRGEIGSYVSAKGRKEAVLLAALCLIFLAVFYSGPADLGNRETLSQTEKSPPELPRPDSAAEVGRQAVRPGRGDVSAGQVEADEKEASEARIIRSLPAFLESADASRSRDEALKAALDLWGAEADLSPHLNGISKSRTYFRLAASLKGFSVHQIAYDLELIRKLNLPAIIGFETPGRRSVVYLTLFRVEQDRVLLRGGDETISATPEELARDSLGMVHVMWRDFSSCKGKIPIDAPPESIIALKMLLRDIGYSEVDTDPVYDERTELIVRGIQEKHGIDVDGIVGPLTKISIYNEIGSLRIPHIAG